MLWRLGRDGVEIEDRGLHDLAATECQQPLRERGGAVCRLLDLSDLATNLVLVFR